MVEWSFSSLINSLKQFAPKAAFRQPFYDCIHTHDTSGMFLTFSVLSTRQNTDFEVLGIKLLNS